MESKYIVCPTVVQKGVWFKRFIHDFDMVVCASKTVTIYYGSMETLA